MGEFDLLDFLSVELNVDHLTFGGKLDHQESIYSLNTKFSPRKIIASVNVFKIGENGIIFDSIPISIITDLKQKITNKISDNPILKNYKWLLLTEHAYIFGKLEKTVHILYKI